VPPPLPANNNSKMPRLRPKFAANRAHDLCQAPFIRRGITHLYGVHQCPLQAVQQYPTGAAIASFASFGARGDAETVGPK